MRHYLRYRPDIEQADPEENKAIDGIIAAMTRQSHRENDTTPDHPTGIDDIPE